MLNGIMTRNNCHHFCITPNRNSCGLYNLSVRAEYKTKRARNIAATMYAKSGFYVDVKDDEQEIEFQCLGTIPTKHKQVISIRYLLCGTKMISDSELCKWAKTRLKEYGL